MSITVQYATTRREVWTFYWCLWQQRLWRIHAILFILAAVSFSFAVFGGWPRNGPEWLSVVPAGLMPLVLLALYPVLMFKPQTRILTVDDDGLATTIGKHKRSLEWGEIAHVRNGGGALIIQRHNFNAFIVPARAFGSPEAQSSFEEFVRAHVQPR